MSRFKLSLLGASLMASLFSFALSGTAFAEAPTADIRSGMQTPPPVDQRVALVIGNANYKSAPKLANPGNDAQSMTQLLNSAGFEVTQAIDLTRSDMVRVVQDFTAKVAERGPGTVAMIYYAGHGVQIEGENYLLPVDAKISTPYDLDGNSLRLVDLMGTLDAIQPDAHRRARRLPQQSVPGSQRRRAGPGDRRCTERLDRRLLDRAGHGSGRWRRQPQPVHVRIPQCRARTEPADRAIVQARPARGQQHDQGPPDAMGEFLADDRISISSAIPRSPQAVSRIAVRSCRWRRTCPRVQCGRPTITWCRKATREL